MTSDAFTDVIFSRLAAITSVTHQLSSKDCNVLSFPRKVKAFRVCHLLPGRLVIAVTVNTHLSVAVSPRYVREWWQERCSVHHFD